MANQCPPVAFLSGHAFPALLQSRLADALGRAGIDLPEGMAVDVIRGPGHPLRRLPDQCRDGPGQSRQEPIRASWPARIAGRLRRHRPLRAADHRRPRVHQFPPHPGSSGRRRRRPARRRTARRPARRPRRRPSSWISPRRTSPSRCTSATSASTIIGDALARIARFLGHEVITDNHIGDWGTQFGMILHGWKTLLDHAALRRRPGARTGAHLPRGQRRAPRPTRPCSKPASTNS